MVVSRMAVLRWEPLPARMQRCKPPKSREIGRGKPTHRHGQGAGGGAVGAVGEDRNKSRRSMGDACG